MGFHYFISYLYVLNNKKLREQSLYSLSLLGHESILREVQYC